MQFNVNKGVVKMFETLAKSKSLQILVIILAIIVQLPAILSSIALFL